MANLTVELALSESWTEITAPLSLTDGSRYLIDAIGVNYNATVFVADTDDADTEPTIKGHPLKPMNRYRRVDSRIYKKRAGAFTWVRVSGGTGTLVVTEVA